MSDSAQLLRMLEPAVRPVDVPKGSTARPASVPFESRSFESLLDEAQRTGLERDGLGAGQASPMQDASAEQSVAEATTSSNALRPLSGLGQIENATLRQIMAAASSGFRIDPGSPPGSAGVQE